MYRKDTDGWLKHWDFILLDMICLQLAFVLAYGLSGYGFNPYQTMIYRNMSILYRGCRHCSPFFTGYSEKCAEERILSGISDHSLSEHCDGSCVCPLSVPHTARTDVFQAGYDPDIFALYFVGLYYQNSVEKISAKQENGSGKPLSAYCNY